MTTFYHVGGVAGTYVLGLLMDRLGAHRMQIMAMVRAPDALIKSIAATALPPVASIGSIIST